MSIPEWIIWVLWVVYLYRTENKLRDVQGRLDAIEARRPRHVSDILAKFGLSTEPRKSDGVELSHKKRFDSDF